MARAKTLVAVFLATLFLLLPISQANEIKITPENSVVNPDNAEPADRWMGIDFDHWGKELDRVTDIVQNATSWTKLFDVENMSALIAPFTSGLRAITAGIDTVIGLIAAGGSISGYLDIALNILNAFYTTLAGIASSIIGILPGSIIGIFSGGIAILDAIGGIVVAGLVGIGLTVEGIIGLTVIGMIISLLASAASILLNVINFAYTSGVAGIAVVALLLVVLSFVGLAVLGGAIVVLAAGEAILFVLVAVLFVIGFFAAIITLGLACILFGIVITILTGMSAVGFTIIAVIELIIKVMTTLMNTVSVPTSIFTALPSWLGLLLCNFPASCLITLLPLCGTGLSCFYTFYPLISPIVVIVGISIFLLLVPVLGAMFVSVFLSLAGILWGAIIGFIIGLLFFFILGFIWMPIIGAILGIIIAWILGIPIGIITGIIFDFIVLILSPLLLIFVIIVYIISIPVNMILTTFLIMLITFILSGCISFLNFFGIGADAITGFAGLIVTGITLMLMRVVIDLMQTTLISEVVSVLVLFLQKLQEISFLTKMAAYPIEVCVGITMLCAAIGMFLLNILMYPFNFVWQFVDMCLKGCYGVACKPFIKPLGWS